MRLTRLSGGLVALAISSLVLVQVSAQAPPPVQMTGCFTKGGDAKNWAFGDQPLKPCGSNDEQVTLVLQAGLDQLATATGDADAALQGALSAESLARAGADSTLQADISANTSSIASNSSIINGHEYRLSATESEIGIHLPTSRITQNSERSLENRIEMVGPNIDLDPSRIDLNENQNLASAAWRPGLIHTGEGAIGHNRLFYRMLNYNPVTGEAMLHAEINHSLDPVSLSETSGYWYCNVGVYLSQGDLQWLFEHQPDDFSTISSSGFTQSSSDYWTFQFKNSNGTPYVRVQVWDSDHPDAGANGAQPHYVDVTADLASAPVTGWIYGNRGIDPSFGDTEPDIFVGLSHPQLRQMLIDSGRGVRIPTSDNDVLVDLNASLINVKYTLAGTCRVPGC